MERIITDRTVPDAAFIQIDVGQPRDRSLRSTRSRSCRQQRTVHGVVFTFLEESQVLLRDGNVATFLPTRSIPVGGRTGPVHRKNVTRQDLNQPRRVTHSRERPVHTFTTSLFPVRGMEWEPASIQEDTHDQPRTFSQRELPSRSCSRLSLQALRTRVQNTSHCLTRQGSALWGKPVAIPDVTHLPDLGHTTSAARVLMPCMVDGAMPNPAAPKLRTTASLLLRFAALHRRLLITPTDRLEPPPASTRKSRVLLVTPTLIPSSSSPLRSNTSVSTLEQHVVDLGEMTRLSLSQANVMIFGRVHHLLDHGGLATHRT